MLYIILLKLLFYYYYSCCINYRCIVVFYPFGSTSIAKAIKKTVACYVRALFTLINAYVANSFQVKDIEFVLILSVVASVLTVDHS